MLEEFAPWFTEKKTAIMQLPAPLRGFATAAPLAFASPRSGAITSECYPCGEELPITALPWWLDWLDRRIHRKHALWIERLMRLAGFEGQAGCQPRERSPQARLVVSDYRPIDICIRTEFIFKFALSFASFRG